MFDRIGRIDDETPFIVEGFVKTAGVEARLLNEQGYKTANGKKFTSKAVIRILSGKLARGYTNEGETSEALQKFDSADMEQKKMIACQLFDRIELGKDYKLTIYMNHTYKQFCSAWVKEHMELTA